MVANGRGLGVMIQPSAKPVKPPVVKYNSTTDWMLGTISRLDDDRTPAKAIHVGENVVLSQNGTIKPRPGLKLYGTQPANPVLGEVYEFVKFSGTTPETWLIWGENDASVGKIYVAKDGGAATLVTGKTYDSTASLHYEQIANKVLITNGVDNLSYMDIDALTITTFTALTTPSITSTTPTGLTGTNWNLRYRVTATNQGETAASTAGTCTVVKTRGLWDGTTDYVTIVWPRVTGADRYNIYVGDQAGFEYYLDTVVDPGTGTDVTYVDSGAIEPNVLRLAPVGDSTSGPITTRSTNVKGQVYMVGDLDNPSRIWFGGNTNTSALDFSSYNGGGWVEPNKGGKDFPVKVVPFRDGKGTPMAACLSKGTNGFGKRYLLQPASVTVGDTVITYMNVQEDNGQDGTDSPDGVAIYSDALWYPSRDAFKTSTTKAQIQNIISTSGISDNISDAVTVLNSSDMEKAVTMVDDKKIYWGIPYQSTTNNQIWILDLRQRGAWMRPWLIAADWMTLYAENSTGVTKRIFLVNNQFMELDESTRTNDNGTAFSTTIGSGNIKFSEDGEQYGQVIDVTFIFLRPQGNINLTVSANTEDGPVILTDSVDNTANDAVSAWGAYGWGAVGWGNIQNQDPLTTTATPSRVRKTIEVDEEVNFINWAVDTTGSGVDYELATVIIRYVPTGWVDTTT